MKSILGFAGGETPETTAIAAVPHEEEGPVRSLVAVSFAESGRALTYYNDRFVLEPGDRVFVSGKFAGKPGVVESVTTKFRINLADYQRVISKACNAIHGSYEAILDKMVSRDAGAMSPEEFRSRILPPAHWEGDGSEENEDEIIVGDGYELDLSDPAGCDELSAPVMERAADYCRSGKVAYIAVRGGIGTAYVEGSTWYEVNFRLHGNRMTEMYCGCPYPGFCKHLVAVAMTVGALGEIGGLDTEADFTAIDADRFWHMVSRTAKRITL